MMMVMVAWRALLLTPHLSRCERPLAKLGELRINAGGGHWKGPPLRIEAKCHGMTMIGNGLSSHRIQEKSASTEYNDNDSRIHSLSLVAVPTRTPCARWGACRWTGAGNSNCRILEVSAGKLPMSEFWTPCAC